MNLIFEPADLDFASPATVSRCGMIYLEPTQLGWRSLYKSYLKELNERLIPEQIELFMELIEWLIPPTLEFVTTQCRRFVQMSELYLFFVCIFDYIFKSSFLVMKSYIILFLVF